ncbi:MAG: 23S rRNA (uracil(1939)-C(5))-methyltransferase RlmD [Coriobacteriia bacterium]|nr:23S rRNA (uracil(1939)-C(5))-methyltransferase RlmD [Coriobacteriia bacterium]
MRVSVESLAHGGDAVARLDDGRVAFVRGGCPGDVLEIEIIADHGSRVDAMIASVLDPSPDRVKPPCLYFGRCGGCQWQHVSAEVQHAAKTRNVSDALARIGKLDVAVSPIVSSSSDYGYRNKVEFVVEESDRGLQLGLHRRGDTTLLPVLSCLLLPRQLQKAPHALAGALRYLAGRHGPLGVHRVGIRVARHTTDVEVALWTSPGHFPRQMAAKALADAVGASGVVRVLVKGPPNQRNVTGVEVLKGRGNWRETLGGNRMAISAPSFFQVNTHAAEALVDHVIEALSPGENDRVLDLYSGAGTFTLPLAARAGEVVAVEGSRHALADLRRNLESAQVYADVVGGDVSRELPALGTFDLAVLDPPRSGLDREARTALTGTGARTIAYVSCDPATLARDARELCASGYRIARVTPHDLFPQTYHVESVAIFERDDL